MWKRWWLCLPPLVAYSADVTATLLGQPVEYWDGNYNRPLEANPIGWWLLSISPWAALVAAALWAIAFTLVVRYWRFRVPTAAILTASHTFGVSTWLIRLGWPGWVGVAIAFVVIERLWAVCRRMERASESSLNLCR
jgi:hypothetical protein